MTLSVCLIVKNEEAVLSRCLDCVKKFADEIVVVDTGSEDRTAEIARGYTDKVYIYPWCDDFSKARNYSFSKATCDYIMWLDADDVVEDEDVAKILRLKSVLVADCYTMLYHVGYDGAGIPDFTFYRERIIRRGKGIWRGFVHEYIDVSGSVVRTDIAVYHRKTGNSGRRNLNIYRRHKNEPFSPRDNYYYARELYYNGYYTSAIKYMRKCLFAVSPHDRADGAVILADCYIKRGDTGRALSCLLEVLKSVEPKGELCCKIGEVYLLRGMPDSAVFWYKSALTLSDEVYRGGFVRREYTTIVPALQLTATLYSLGRTKEAEEYHILSKLLSPEHPSVKFNERFFKNFQKTENNG